MHFEELFLFKYLKIFAILSIVMLVLCPLNILSVKTSIGILEFFIGICYIIMLVTMLKYRNQVISLKFTKKKDYLLFVLALSLMVIIPLLRTLRVLSLHLLDWFH